MGRARMRWAYKSKQSSSLGFPFFVEFMLSCRSLETFDDFERRSLSRADPTLVRITHHKSLLKGSIGHRGLRFFARVLEGHNRWPANRSGIFVGKHLFTILFAHKHFRNQVEDNTTHREKSLLSPRPQNHLNGHSQCRNRAIPHPPPH